ncbi:MAG TPA: TonB-dependent receptor [Gemmatirosa sp.]|nr:TonB-dependent receptor [Gemmatirosa sp.]
MRVLALPRARRLPGGAALLVLLAAALARPAIAQQPPAAPATPRAAPGASGAPGVVTGIVYDSLFTQRPLADAEVWVEGTGLTARSDASGRYRLPGVAAGRHRVTFFHPSLEQLGVSAPVRAVDVPVGGTVDAPLVTPAPDVVHQALCAATRELKTGVMLGRVRGGQPLAPIPEATLTLSWNAFTLSSRGLERTPRELGARTGADGTYFVCGVPTDVPVQVRVQGSGVVSVAEVSLRDQTLAVHLIDLPSLAVGAAERAAPSPADAVAPGAGTGAGTIVGVLQTPQGRPVSGAVVEIVGAGLRATTSATGAFVLRGAALGTQTVEARALGFRPVRTRLVLDAGRPAQLQLTVSDNVVVLAPTRVTAPRYGAMIAGYEQRRRGGAGNFITAEEIEQRRPFTVNDLLVTVPGVQVILPNAGAVGVSPRVVFQRSLGLGGAKAAVCDPIMYVDGARVINDDQLGSMIDQLIRPQDIHGVEIYRSLASAPPQFQVLDSSCGVILFWTRRGKG